MPSAIGRLRRSALAAGMTLGLAAGASGENAATTHHYEILRNGSPVGTHRVDLKRQPRYTEVRAQTRIDIRLLGLSLYRFLYTAEELWDEQGLLRLTVSLDDDGKQSRLDGERSDGVFRWTVDGGETRRQPLPVFPTNHWNSGILAQRQVLNTLTGKLNIVDISPADPEPGFDGARTFRYRGELQLTSWYDRRGNWLGMRFEGEDGATIEYRCRDCPVEVDS